MIKWTRPYTPHCSSIVDSHPANLSLSGMRQRSSSIAHFSLYSLLVALAISHERLLFAPLLCLSVALFCHKRYIYKEVMYGITSFRHHTEIILCTWCTSLFVVFAHSVHHDRLADVSQTEMLPIHQHTKFAVENFSVAILDSHHSFGLLLGGYDWINMVNSDMTHALDTFCLLWLIYLY